MFIGLYALGTGMLYAGCSKRLSSKAAGESKPEAYPLRYVEDFDEPSTMLEDFFSILLQSHCTPTMCGLIHFHLLDSALDTTLLLPYAFSQTTESATILDGFSQFILLQIPCLTEMPFHLPRRRQIRYLGSQHRLPHQEFFQPDPSTSLRQIRTCCVFHLLFQQTSARFCILKLLPQAKQVHPHNLFQLRTVPPQHIKLHPIDFIRASKS
jgi:hypothetical protein